MSDETSTALSIADSRPHGLRHAADKHGPALRRMPNAAAGEQISGIRAPRGFQP